MDFCLRVKNDLLRVGSLGGDDGILTLDDLEEFLSILSNEDVKFLDDNILNMVAAVSRDPSLWPVLITPSQRKSITDIAMEAATAALSKQDVKRYLTTWLKVRKFLDSLTRPKVDTRLWGKLRDDTSKLQGHSFDSNLLGLLVRPTYSTSSTSTGRLTITKGPNFLVAPAVTRKLLRPKSNVASVMIVDFKSMEPRVALMTADKHAEENDTYESLMKICGISDRPAAKLATLAALYGASEFSLIETIGTREQAKSLIANVRDFFGAESLERRLEEEASDGMIRNYFGRPLHDATANRRVRVNHFVQSTAAELSVMLFADLCERVPSVTPILVIHDALIVEVPNSSIDIFRAECDNLKFQGTKFPTTIHDVRDI